MRMGEILNEKWRVGVRHALYREDGTWNHILKWFPAAYFDKNGYVKFRTQSDYDDYRKRYCNGIIEVSFPWGISGRPGYIKVR